MCYDLANVRQIGEREMTDEELKELVASLAIAQKHTDGQIVQLQESIKETNASLKRVGVDFGNMKKNQGDVAEEFFFNSLGDDPHLGTIHFDNISKNSGTRCGKLEEEYDIVMTNGNAIGIVEVKYKAHENDLKKLERKMRNFKKLFPVYENYKLYGAIATFNFYDEAKEAALNQGFFVLQRSGKVVQTDCGENLLVL